MATRKPERIASPGTKPGRTGGQANGYSRHEAVRVMQIIARMNIGGPAYHVSLLGGRMDRERYSTLLVHGEVGPGEASFAELADSEGCRVDSVTSLGPELRPVADLRALVELVTTIRRFRPHIVHTHTAKAGALGRLAACLSVRPRPVIVHTYHGHVLSGYFGSRVTAIYRAIERLLAKVTDRLVGVSQATVDDLVAFQVAPSAAFEVIPLGLDLERFFQIEPDAGRELREQVGAGADEVLLTYVGRLAPIKRVDVLLNAFALLHAEHPNVRLAIVGDGESRPSLERLADELGLRRIVRFVGYMTDVTPVAAAADVAVLSSDNEGTPVSLIEAGAAGVPCVATSVGGNVDVVPPNAGILVPPRDPVAMASALARLVDDRSLRSRMGGRARDHVHERFRAERMLQSMDRLYEKLLERRSSIGTRGAVARRQST
jgi:glycosyltransferase involved in cell wall biosynthesis